MAGPLSSEEIEDVVSSVRRLVSNEQRPRNVSRDVNADRLLLTPALRVVSDSAPAAPLILDSPLVETVTAPETEVEPAANDAVELVEAEWEDELWIEPGVTSLGEVALGAEEAEVLIAPPEEPLLSQAGQGDDYPEPWAQIEAAWVERRPTHPPKADHVTEAYEAFEAEEYEPETPTIEPDDKASTQRISTEILDADGTPLAVLDESALQEIVRLIIREELQGSLGERITRSVRKLVRAEINRALVERDLD
jgi:hypothetical protein